MPRNSRMAKISRYEACFSGALRCRPCGSPAAGCSPPGAPAGALSAGASAVPGDSAGPRAVPACSGPSTGPGATPGRAGLSREQPEVRSVRGRLPRWSRRVQPCYQRARPGPPIGGHRQAYLCAPGTRTSFLASCPPSGPPPIGAGRRIDRCDQGHGGDPDALFLCHLPCRITAAIARGTGRVAPGAREQRRDLGRFAPGTASGGSAGHPGRPPGPAGKLLVVALCRGWPPSPMLGRSPTAGATGSTAARPSEPPSSSGLGHRPFKAAARVRIPLGAPAGTAGGHMVL